MRLLVLTNIRIRMTAMPAWGDPADGEADHETWALVAFIRHLPELTAEEERAMKKLNPKTDFEREEEEEENDILNGKPTKETPHGDSNRVR